MSSSRSDVVKTSFQVPGDSGIILHARKWEAVQARQKRKFLVVTHGACEHGGRYNDLLERAAHQGWTAVAIDLRGHGQSTGNYVHVEQFADYSQDLLSVLNHIEAPPESTILLGCSMGGLVSIRTLQNHWKEHNCNPCKGLVLLSPLLGIKHPIEMWKKIIARGLSVTFPRTRFRSTIDLSLLSHDREVIESKRNDPRIRGAVTARWFWEMRGAIEAAFRDVDCIQVPTLLLQSGADFVVDPLASKVWSNLINNSDASENPHQVHFRLLENWYHEILNEPQGPVVADAVLKFGTSILNSNASHYTLEALPAAHQAAS